MRRLVATAGALVIAFTVLPGVSAQAPAPAPRSNPVIDLLEQNKPAFSNWANYIGSGNDYQTAVTLQNNENFDFIIYDLEHDPLDVSGLSMFLRSLLDPAAIAREGVNATQPVFVRIPPNGREIRQNQWMVKQILDTGVAGLLFPYVETAEQAIDALQAVRYAQPLDAPHVEPEGERGYSPSIAARYWGMSVREYERHADVWGLQPDADMLVILIIESKRGVDHVREIARAVRDTGAKVVLWAGGGDMSLSYGRDEKLTEAGILKVMEAGKEFGLPVGVNGTRDFQTRYDQGFRVFMDVGPAYLAGAPHVTPEQRKAVGR